MNWQDRSGNTPLMQTAQHSPTDVMEVLLRYGADLSIMDVGGTTALDISLDWNKKAIWLLKIY